MSRTSIQLVWQEIYWHPYKVKVMFKVKEDRMTGLQFVRNELTLVEGNRYRAYLTEHLATSSVNISVL